MEPLSTRNELASYTTLLSLFQQKLEKMKDFESDSQKPESKMANIYRASQMDILEHSIALTQKGLQEFVQDNLSGGLESPLFLHLEHPELDSEFLAILDGLNSQLDEDDQMDYDMLLILMIAHEKSRGPLSAFHTLLSSLYRESDSIVTEMVGRYVPFDFFSCQRLRKPVCVLLK